MFFSMSLAGEASIARPILRAHSSSVAVFNMLVPCIRGRSTAIRMTRTKSSKAGDRDISTQWPITCPGQDGANLVQDDLSAAPRECNRQAQSTGAVPKIHTTL